MLKNRYFRICFNGNEFLIRVKKDFYTEGISTKNNQVIQGYFDFYKYLCLNVLDTNDDAATIFAHKGIVGDFNRGLGETYLDEELNEHGTFEKFKASLLEVESLDNQKEIDFLIRNAIRSLNSNNREIYDFFNGRRRSRFNGIRGELNAPIHSVDGSVFVLADSLKEEFSATIFQEISEYLDSIDNQSKKTEKGKDSNNKKLRKRKKNKK